MRRHCNLVRTRPFVSPAVLLHTWRSSICYLRQLGLLTFRPQLHQPRENDGVAVRASSFPSGLNPAGIDKYNKKIMIAAIRGPDLFRVGNQFTHDTDIRDLELIH
jgi:hypothetical protein